MADFTDTTEQAAPQTGDYIIGYRGSTDSRWLWETWLDNFDTDDLAEGATNLFFTNERMDDRFNQLFIAGIGCDGTYNDGAGTYTLDVTLSGNSTQQLSESANSNHWTQPAWTSINNDAVKILFDTPIAPANFSVPAGRAYMLVGAVAKAHIVTTGYTNNGVDIVDTATGAILMEIPSTVLNTVGDTVAHFQFTTGGKIITEANTVSIKAKTGNPTGGNAANTLKVYLEYRLIDFSTVV